ncbi:acyl carrier protein [Streptomyces sp. RB6PN25]|uniref:Acyl carrier protein n=1 Tax=Streptomyces humicola TaxID=2953240 RepID=A0ABT1PTD0_9ACTN|nr:acyl carrier protein [Streptomyces humicola]MCQ4080925.1 acyl carrier protein [Streptomyces humicola]
MAAVAQQEAGERLRGIVATVLEMDADDISLSASFYEELSVSSLEKVEISVRLEREFAVSLAPEEMTGVRSIADALDLLRRKGVVV